MKESLILVKHSLPEIVRSLPAREWKLSEEGQRRAQRLAERLRPLHPEVIISSMELKARETAKIIADRLGLDYHLAHALHEHDRSKMSYLSEGEFQAAMREFFERPESLVFGGETAEEACVRFHRAVYAVLESHPDQSIVIVAHGTVISLFISRLTGIPAWSLWKRLGLPSYASIDLQTNTLMRTENIP